MAKVTNNLKNKSNLTTSSTILEDLVQDFSVDLTKENAVLIVQRAYKTRQPLVDIKKLKEYRDLDKGIIDEESLKKLLDPKGKESVQMESGEFITTDWKPSPLIHSLNRISKGYIIDSISDIRVDGIDRLSADKKIRKRQEEVTKKYAIDLINFINSATNESPIDYNENLDKFTQAEGEESQPINDTGINILEQIKSELDDDWHFALLSDVGGLKDGVESAHEIMIKYYLEKDGFIKNIAEELASDIMKVRTCSYRFYTSAMDGTPQIHYISPDKITISQFKEKDGRDIDYWFYEFVVTFSDFMKMIGGKLPIEQIKKIYEANRTAFYPDNLTWSETPAFFNSLFTTNINLGYFEVKKHIEDNGKYYDKTKKFYYLPLLSTMTTMTSDFILDLGDLQDMTRHGGDLQYSKFSLVVYRDDNVASWYDIQKSDLTRLNIFYNQYLNTATNIIPRGVVFAEETLSELVEDMLNAKREYMNENNQELTNESGVYQKILQDTIRKFKSKGMGVFKRRENDDPNKQLDAPTSQINHSLYEDLSQILNNMMAIYNMMITSLGTNPILLGQAPKQHQTLKGIEIANQSGMSMLQEMIQMLEFSVTEYGHRMIYYNKQIIENEFTKEMKPKTQRAEQMQSILGNSGIAWLEIFKDMPIQDCTMKVENKPTDEQRVMLFDYTSQLEKAGRLPFGTSLMVQEIKNFKLAKLFVIASQKRQERIAVENQMAMMKQQSQAQQQAQSQALQIASAQKQEDASLEARLMALENQLKQDGMSKNIEERGANKEKENQQKAQLEVQKEAQKKQLEMF